MRLFVAIHPDAATEPWLAAEQQRLRRALGRSAQDWRWLEPASIHLTLSFLGEMPEASAIMEALETCRCAPMELTVGGTGFFPNARRPNVIWAGVRDASGDLLRLQEQVTRVLAPFVEPERRSFEPHLTLARLRPRAHPEHSVATLATPGGSPPQTWPVTGFSLMQSQLERGGARHEVVKSFRAIPANK